MIVYFNNAQTLLQDSIKDLTAGVPPNTDDKATIIFSENDALHWHRNTYRLR
jgi:hypothetical protein